MSDNALLERDFNAFVKDATQRRVLTERQSSTLFYVKIAIAVLSLISFITALVLVLVDGARFSLHLLATSDFRTGVVPLDDQYPSLVGGSQGNNELSELGEVNFTDVGQVAAFVSLFATIGYGAAAVFHNFDVQQINIGVNVFLWLNLLFWHWLAIVALACVAGIHSIILKSALGALAFCAILIVWLADINSSDAVREVRNAMRAGINDPTARWDWLPLLFVAAPLLLIVVQLLVYLGFTFGNQRWAAPDVNSTPLIAAVVVNLLLYIAPFVIYAFYFNKSIGNYAHQLTQLILNAIFALSVTWLTLGMFALDGIDGSASALLQSVRAVD